jgi:hypothetical protein
LYGRLETVEWLLRKGGSHIGERDNNGSTAFKLATLGGKFETLVWLLREGGSRIGEADNKGSSALILAAGFGTLETVRWLLQEGGSSIREVNHSGFIAMLNAADCDMYQTTTWLLGHGGVDILDVTNDGKTVWAILKTFLVEAEDPVDAMFDAWRRSTRVWCMRLRAQLPAYLVQRQALLDRAWLRYAHRHGRALGQGAWRGSLEPMMMLSRSPCVAPPAAAATTTSVICLPGFPPLVRG